MYYSIGLLFLISAFLYAPSYGGEIDGVYKILNPEPGRLNQPIHQVRLSQNQTTVPKTIRKIRCYPGCTAGAYIYLAEASNLSGSEIYMSSVGEYLIRYADQVWINVDPNSALGEGSGWEYFMFINVYTRPESPVELDQIKAAEFAINLSKNLVDKSYTPSQFNAHYYLLTPIYQQKKYQMQASVELQDSLITLSLCDSCKKKQYQFVEKISRGLHARIYDNGQGSIIILLDKGFIWAEFNGKLGKEEWQKDWFYNVYSKDDELIKTLRTNKNKLAEIDQFLYQLSSYAMGKGLQENIVFPDFMMFEETHFN